MVEEVPVSLEPKQEKTGLVEIYSELTGIRALVNLVPYVGGALDVMLSSKGQTVAAQRFEKMLNELNAEMKKVSDDKVDTAYIGSDGFREDLFDFFRHTQDAKDKERLSMFARILRGKIEKQKPKGFDYERFIRIARQLELEDVIFISKVVPLLNAKTTPKKSIALEEIVQALPEFSGVGEYVMRKLQGLGLFREWAGAIMGYAGGTFEMTEVLSEFYNFLNDVNS